MFVLSICKLRRICVENGSICIICEYVSHSIFTYTIVDYVLVALNFGTRSPPEPASTSSLATKGSY